MIRRRIGTFNIEVLPHPYGTGCRSTIHCANFGFCNRCAPELARAATHVLQAMNEVGRATDGKLYDQITGLLKAGVAPPAGAQPGTESGVEEWVIDSDR